MLMSGGALGLSTKFFTSIISSSCNHPDTVLICEKQDGQTQIERLSVEPLKEW